MFGDTAACFLTKSAATWTGAAINAPRTAGHRGAADPDTRVLSDEDLENAKREGEARH
jgi:hypothetical protein